MKKSFTIIELIFVIVIIGILAAVAIPRLFTGVSDAKIAKAKTQIATIRSGIASQYSKNILAGNSDTCPNTEGNDNNKLFEGVISGGITPNEGDVSWQLLNQSADEVQYKLTIDNNEANFTYELNASKDCPFKCVSSTGDLCNKLQ